MAVTRLVSDPVLLIAVTNSCAQATLVAEIFHLSTKPSAKVNYTHKLVNVNIGSLGHVSAALCEKQDEIISRFY